VNGLPTIRSRLSTVLVVVSLAWGAAVSLVLWLSVRHEVDELLDTTLQESAEILYGLLQASDGHWPDGALPAAPHDEHLVWQVVGAESKVLARSYRAPVAALTDRRTRGWADAGHEWRVFALPFVADGRMLYVAQPSPERHEARLDVAAFTVGGALLVGLLCAAWLRRRVAVELDPITEMSRSVDRFDPGHAAAELPLPRRQELVPIHRAIVDLAHRLSQRVAVERAFAAHAAHALRTPLAGMVMQLAVARRLADSAVRPHLDQTREAADRLQRVVAALLTMFRSGGEPRMRAATLGELVGQARFGAMQVGVDAGAELQVDPDLMAAALMNLLDNSVRHGASHALVTFHATTQSIRVTDDGPGMPEARREQLQRALDRQEYEGCTGLGLMLADRVARAHGGLVQLRAVNAGCVVEIRLGGAAGEAAPQQAPQAA